MLKPDDLRQMTEEELREQENDLSQQLFTLRMQKVMQGQLENPLKIREAKRDLARVLTVLGEKQRAATAAG